MALGFGGRGRASGPSWATGREGQMGLWVWGAQVGRWGFQLGLGSRNKEMGRGGAGGPMREGGEEKGEWATVGLQGRRGGEEGFGP